MYLTYSRWKVIIGKLIPPPLSENVDLTSENRKASTIFTSHLGHTNSNQSLCKLTSLILIAVYRLLYSCYFLGCFKTSCRCQESNNNNFFLNGNLQWYLAKFGLDFPLKKKKFSSWILQLSVIISNINTNKKDAKDKVKKKKN